MIQLLIESRRPDARSRQLVRGVRAGRSLLARRRRFRTPSSLRAAFLAVIRLTNAERDAGFLATFFTTALRRAGRFRLSFCAAGLLRMGFLRTGFFRTADGARRRFIGGGPRAARGPSW